MSRKKKGLTGEDLSKFLIVVAGAAISGSATAGTIATASPVIGGLVAATAALAVSSYGFFMSVPKKKKRKRKKTKMKKKKPKGV